MTVDRTRRATAATLSSPTSVGDRHSLVDALRGVALLGIVSVNVEFIAQHGDVGWSRDTASGDLATRWMVTTFAELKVYPLFALLFGYGLTVQLDHAQDTGAGIGARYGRRMVGLALLGVAHAVLFFPGDVLVVYAAVGAVCFSVRHRSSLCLIRIATPTYAAAALFWVVVGAAAFFAGADLVERPLESSLETLATGSFGEVVGQHLIDWPPTLAFLALVQGPAALAFALVGMALGRTDILSNPGLHRASARRALLIAGPVGMIGAGLGATLTVRGGALNGPGFALEFLVAPAVSGAYLAALVLIWPRVPAAIGCLLRSAGRMSLSVYLLESVALSTLSYSYGGALFGHLSPAKGVLLAIGVWFGLSLFAVVWLRYARFGPAEWLLRTVSYGRAQPLLTRRTS